MALADLVLHLNSIDYHHGFIDPVTLAVLPGSAWRRARLERSNGNTIRRNSYCALPGTIHTVNYLLITVT
jgi:hypothetical protein